MLFGCLPLYLVPLHVVVGALTAATALQSRGAEPLI